jgi:hypothetical protein
MEKVMNEHPMQCIKCGSPIDQPLTGRPRSYCSTGCRRAAEKEIGRLNDHLAKLEAMAIQLRLGTGLVIASEANNIVSEIERAEARMRVLLAAAPE